MLKQLLDSVKLTNLFYGNPDSQFVSRLIELTRTVEDLKKQKYSIQNRLEYQTDKTVQVSLNKVIKSIDNEIEKLEKEIKKLLSEDDDLNNKTDLLTSIPGFGEQTAGIILAETKGEPEKFVSSRALAAYAGLTPARRQSGVSLNKTRLSKVGSKYLRSRLFFPTLAAIRSNPIIQSFYKRLLDNGKTKMQALCACTAKLLKIAYGVLKSQKPFDPNYQNLSLTS